MAAKVHTAFSTPVCPGRLWNPHQVSTQLQLEHVGNHWNPLLVFHPQEVLQSIEEDPHVRG